VDAWATPIEPRESDDPVEWAHAIFTLPRAVIVLMRVRDAVVRPFGLAAGWGEGRRHTGFPIIDRGPHEVVLGADDKHLDFRVGIVTAERWAVVTTTLRLNNHLGTLYWAVVKWFHPWVVRATLRRARPPGAEGKPAAAR
jgi:hypothetical protein